MPRRKPISNKQRKEQLQLKRAVKRGDLPPEAIARNNASSSGRGRGRGRGRSFGNANVGEASRRLQSSFVKFSPAFLEETKRKASSLILGRPILPEHAILPISEPKDEDGPKLSIMRRPKWNYEMNKKQVEHNEEGVFKKWLEETDKTLDLWKDRQNAARIPVPEEIENAEEDVKGKGKVDENLEDAEDLDTMPFSAPLYERNLEVWRQLWRVTEISQILLVLLDSRCPLLHYPPSLHKYLSSFRPPRKVIFVLTKIDITGQDRVAHWTAYLKKVYPEIRIVQVESYQEKKAGEGQGKRKAFEPHLPSELRRNLVQALKEAHQELCTPPTRTVEGKGNLAPWRSNIKQDIAWDALLSSSESSTAPFLQRSDEVAVSHEDSSTSSEEGDVNENFITVGLIGQPNVGKSSLLNALFGAHKVKASRTPGKTKHFQTLFWTNEIRLVDCPGLVFPGFVNMELQVLAGILPISQIAAISSCVYHALQYLPLEQILSLTHPSKSTADQERARDYARQRELESKRTWREGQKPSKVVEEERWTAMDVLTSFAEAKGWLTAKAGRPDINRAGNAILRAVAEGKIKWAFYPPDTDPQDISRHQDEGQGIWIKHVSIEESPGLLDSEDDRSDEEEFEEGRHDESGGEDEESESQSHSEDGEDAAADDSSSEEAEVPSGFRRHIVTGAGMFAALNLEDDGEEDLEGEEREGGV